MGAVAASQPGAAPGVPGGEFAGRNNALPLDEQERLTLSTRDAASTHLLPESKKSPKRFGDAETASAF